MTPHERDLARAALRRWGLEELTPSETGAGDLLHYDDAGHDRHPHRYRFLANRPLISARFQAALDMADEGCSTTEISWAFNVTIGGVSQLLERARAWQEWRLGKGDRRYNTVPKYAKGLRGKGIPGDAIRADRERIIS